MTRGSVLQLISAAKQSGSTVILGGPESANHSAEYLSAGADVIVVGEGESTLTELVATLPSMGPHGLNGVSRHRLQKRGRRTGAHARANQDQRS